MPLTVPPLTSLTLPSALPGTGPGVAAFILHSAGLLGTQPRPPPVVSQVCPGPTPAHSPAPLQPLPPLPGKSSSQLLWGQESWTRSGHGCAQVTGLRMSVSKAVLQGVPKGPRSFLVWVMAPGRHLEQEQMGRMPLPPRRGGRLFTPGTMIWGPCWRHRCICDEVVLLGWLSPALL